MNRWYFGAVPLSLWVSWAAWRGPPPPKQYAAPSAIQRTITLEERQALTKVSMELTASIQTAQQERGHPIQIHQLEAVDDEGKPFIGMPIPDNPLMPNIASVAERCPPDAQNSTTDWVYCPKQGTILPVINGQSFNGKE